LRQLAKSPGAIGAARSFAVDRVQPLLDVVRREMLILKLVFVEKDGESL
jgi:hypothetical protein